MQKIVSAYLSGDNKVIAISYSGYYIYKHTLDIDQKKDLVVKINLLGEINPQHWDYYKE